MAEPSCLVYVRYLILYFQTWNSKTSIAIMPGATFLKTSILFMQILSNMQISQKPIEPKKIQGTST